MKLKTLFLGLWVLNTFNLSLSATQNNGEDLIQDKNKSSSLKWTAKPDIEIHIQTKGPLEDCCYKNTENAKSFNKNEFLIRSPYVERYFQHHKDRGHTQIDVDEYDNLQNVFWAGKLIHVNLDGVVMPFTNPKFSHTIEHFNCEDFLVYKASHKENVFYFELKKEKGKENQWLEKSLVKKINLEDEINFYKKEYEGMKKESMKEAVGNKLCLGNIRFINNKISMDTYVHQVGLFGRKASLACMINVIELNKKQPFTVFENVKTLQFKSDYPTDCTIQFK